MSYVKVLRSASWSLTSVVAMAWWFPVVIVTAQRLGPDSGWLVAVLSAETLLVAVLAKTLEWRFYCAIDVLVTLGRAWLAWRVGDRDRAVMLIQECEMRIDAERHSRRW